jgi:peptidoglycan-N-acetylglucosamine deacetylase
VRLASISVDLDEIPNYFGIHGLKEPDGPERHLVYDVALDRLSAFAKSSGLPLTLFAIGSDLARPEAAARLKRASEEGHEMANHSLDHRYDFVRLGRDGIARQVEDGARRIQEATGVRPTGFRAPGYTITDEVFEVLGELEVAYDSSVFPCPAYWGLKATRIAWISMLGRTSWSVVDTPAVLLAPTRPYFVGAPYWQRGSQKRGNGAGSVLEIPVQVTRGLRLPFFGTSVTMAGPSRARWLAKMCIGEPLVNLELHGMDVLDVTDGLLGLKSHQPDVGVPWGRKVESLMAVVEVLRAAGYTFVTMAEAAEAVA